MGRIVFVNVIFLSQKQTLINELHLYDNSSVFCGTFVAEVLRHSVPESIVTPVINKYIPPECKFPALVFNIPMACFGDSRTVNYLTYVTKCIISVTATTTEQFTG
jgi:hypothetical protein